VSVIFLRPYTTKILRQNECLCTHRKYIWNMEICETSDKDYLKRPTQIQIRSIR